MDHRAYAEKLYELRCGETFCPSNTFVVYTRVPGGWVYRQSVEAAVFIPFCTEFVPEN